MYHVQAYHKQTDLGRGYDAGTETDTLKEAKAKARHFLTDEYRRLAEMADRLEYAQVLNADGECVADFFGK